MPTKPLLAPTNAGHCNRYLHISATGKAQEGRNSFANVGKDHSRSVSNASSDASCSTAGSSGSSNRYMMLGRIGSTETCSSSSEDSFSSRSFDDVRGHDLQPVKNRHRVHSQTRQSAPLHRQHHESASSRIAYSFAISPLTSLSEVDGSRESIKRNERSGDYSKLVGLAVRNANSSNRQPSTMRRSRHRDSLSPQQRRQILSPPPSFSKVQDLHRRAGRQFKDSSRSDYHWNENVSNNSDIYCFRQLPRQRQSSRMIGKQLLQQQQQQRKYRGISQERQPNKIYSGNHAESNLLLRRKLDSLRRLQSRRHRSCNYRRCSDDDRRATFCGDDCEVGEGFGNGEQDEQPIESVKSQRWMLDKRGRVGRARDPAEWQLTSNAVLDGPVPEQPWCDSARGRMRETRSHRETLFRCPYMSLSLQTKIYECDKCAAQFYNNLNSSRARMQPNSDSQDSGSIESRSESMTLLNCEKGDNRVRERACRGGAVRP